MFGRIKALEKKFNAFNARLELIEDSLDEDWLRRHVGYALQEVLEKNTAMKVVTELNGQEITTKIIRDKRKELAEKKQKLEWALKATNEALEESGEE
jgi:hypothetical protein